MLDNKLADALVVGVDYGTLSGRAVVVRVSDGAEVARTVHISRQLGDPLPIAQADIDRLYDRYQNVYGR